MAARFEYRRMTAEQFEQALGTVGISAREFAKISGATHRKVGEWLAGKEDIPPWVTSYMAMLVLPGALRMARAVADQTIIQDRENMHLGQWPFRKSA